jgi:lysophospholipid acyltransferase 1/2
MWNKTTQNWLRTSAYDRNERYKTLYTYVLSAVWHGFYPGYYLTFLSGALFTEAGRSLRRHFRPLFVGNRLTQFVYDCLTFAATKFAIAYLVFPFVLLEFQTSLQLYRRLYFIGHIGCLFAIFVLPRLIRVIRHDSRRPVDKPKSE